MKVPQMMCPTISIFNVCVRVWGDTQPMFTGQHSQMGACPSEAAQQGAEQGWGACQEKGMPHPSKTPSSSAAHQQCRPWAVTLTTLFHHDPLGFFSIHLACHPQFFSDSRQSTYITLSQPLQLPPYEFIMTVRSFIAFNNNYVQILFTVPTDAWNVTSSSCFIVILATLHWGMKGNLTEIANLVLWSKQNPLYLSSKCQNPGDIFWQFIKYFKGGHEGKPNK